MACQFRLLTQGRDRKWKYNSYLLSETIQSFATLLNPEKEIIEYGLAVGSHVVEVVKVFGGEQVGYCRYDNGGVGSLGIAKGVLQGHCIGCPREDHGLNSWVAFLFFEYRQVANDIRIT